MAYVQKYLIERRPCVFRSQVYFGKTRDVVFDLRSLEDLEKSRMQRELQKELLGSLGKR